MAKKTKKHAAQAQPTPETPIQQKSSWWPILVLTGICVLLYANTIGLQYALDDSIVVSENKFTQQGFAGLPKIFTTDAFVGYFGERGAKLVEGGRYRPLSIASLAVEHQFLGLNPAVSHALNILFYAILVVLLFKLLQLLLPADVSKKWYFSLPFITAALFAAHPIHTEVVANIKGRDEIFALIFSLAALWACIKLWDAPQKLVYIGLAASMLFLGLLSKENPVTFLAVFPLAVVCFRLFKTNLKWQSSQLKSFIGLMVVSVIVFAIYMQIRGMYTVGAVGEKSGEILNNPFINATSSERVATALKTLVLYIKLLIFPHPLTHDYYYNQVPVVGFGDPLALFGLLILVGSLALSFYALKKRWSVVLFSIGFFFITWSIVSNLFFTVGVTMSERFVFVPSLAFCLLVALGLQRLMQQKQRIVALSILAVLLVGYAGKTISRNPVWENNLVLFTNDAEHSPNSAKVQTAAGGELVTKSSEAETENLKKEMLRQGIQHLRKAVEIYPTHSNAWLLMGNGYYQLGDQESEAEKIYKHALALRGGTYFDASYNLATVYINRKEYRKAKVYFEKAIEAKPEQLEAYENMGTCFIQLGQYDSARAMMRKTLSDAEIDYRIGMNLAKEKNQLLAGIPYLKRAVDAEPKNVQYWEDLGTAYGFAQQYEEAKKCFNQVLFLAPNHENAMKNLQITDKILSGR